MTETLRCQRCADPLEDTPFDRTFKYCARCWRIAVMQSHPVLYTAGYGNRTPEGFFYIVPYHVLVVDVRWGDRGRIAPFHADNLQKTFTERGQLYLHAHELGNPDRVNVGEWWEAMKNDPDVQPWMDRLTAWLSIMKHDVLLMCAESDVARCHRNEIAMELVQRIPGLEVRHL